jgi:hypothetical protein
MKTPFRQTRSHIVAFCLLVFANLPGLRQVMANAPLRVDTDTAAMLNAMRDTGGLDGWWLWFTGDWFLHNGFYRPTTCLSLLLDYALYGETGWGYRLTSWVLAVLTALGVYALLLWFARRWLAPLLPDETRRRQFALIGAVVLSLQQTGYLHFLQGLSAWWLIGLWVLWQGWHTLPRTADEWKQWARRYGWRLWLAGGAFFWGWDRLTHSDFGRLIVWVPARTALLSTCLAVWSLWLLLRWGDTGRSGFLLAACLCYAGAVGAYEQPLMLLPVLGVLTFAMRKQWIWRAWVALCLPAAIAAVYLVLRFTLLPAELSGYQQQQLRSSPTIGAIHFIETLAPVLAHVRYWTTVGFSPYLFFFTDAWETLLAGLAFLGVLAAVWRSWRWVGWWLLWQGATYLPMSLLHPFEHYYYLPQVGQNAIDLALLVWALAFTRQVLHNTEPIPSTRFEPS